MAKKQTCEEIVAAADELFYQQGFEHTSFAQIAAVLKISRGNFYHHFKSKDEILEAVIQRRMNNTSLMLEKWEADGDSPSERIRSFVNILVRNQSKILRFGCPLGTLSNELIKLNHPKKVKATALFSLFRAWLVVQFTKLHFADQADEFAMHLLALSQGLATVASAFDDEEFVQREVTRIHVWLDQTIGSNS